MPFDKEQILNRRRDTKVVTIKDYGDVILRMLSLAEMKAVQKKISAAKDDSYQTVLLTVLNCLSDEDGNRLFSDEEANKLSEAVPSPVMTEISNAILYFHYPEKRPAEDAKTPPTSTEVDAAKNS
jgi:hypothetical protein